MMTRILPLPSPARRLQLTADSQLARGLQHAHSGGADFSGGTGGVRREYDSGYARARSGTGAGGAWRH